MFAIVNRKLLCKKMKENKNKIPKKNKGQIMSSIQRRPKLL
jgi:hypothetical protein